MSKKPLWTPPVRETVLTKYINFLKENRLYEFSDYEKLHQWSINNKDFFWKSIWDFSNVVGDYVGPVIKNENNFIESKFFVNSKLNYAENIFCKQNNENAIVFYSEQGQRRSVSWIELKSRANKFSNFLISRGVKRGDRVVAVLPNFPETVVAFLASAKIGAIWSSCSADFGPQAVIDRFGQISPKVLVVSDCYFYNNKIIYTLPKVNEILKFITSIDTVVVIPFDGVKICQEPEFVYENWVSIMCGFDETIGGEFFDFNIPLYILFSSGTTGPPKCIVHSAGGSLLQHKKEHLLHCDMDENTKIFYFTTCGWMMWNWLVSCLASGSAIYLYDGSPFYPRKDYLFEIVENEKITHFGTGAKYIDTLKQENIKIKERYKLTNLKTIFSTGSPLSPESFEYAYDSIKKEVHLASICGGTDIVSCFIGGNPNAPVYAGEIQCKSLGMDVDIFDSVGGSVVEKNGELVCLSPFVSKPLCFWNDKENKKYLDTYFSKYTNVWCQGDYAKQTSRGSFVVYGRSDATLNSGGVRIGTAEIYNVVEKINNIYESVAVEQRFKDGTRVILFVKLKENIRLDDILKEKIKRKIKQSLSPRHVPSKIIQVFDIPKTKSGKVVELAIKKTINNKGVENISSLLNPESLDEYKNIAELKY